MTYNPHVPIMRTITDRGIMRKTHQRTALLEILSHHADHPSADQLYLEVRETLPRVSLGTIYRNLDVLSKSGKILKIETAGGQSRYDPKPHPHPHFRCVACGTLEDVPEPVHFISEHPDTTWQKGRIIHGIIIEYFGICTKCSL